jgi:hypothetical protein
MIQKHQLLTSLALTLLLIACSDGNGTGGTGGSGGIGGSGSIANSKALSALRGTGVDQDVRRASLLSDRKH